MKWIRIHPDDNVVVALEDIRKGETLVSADFTVTAAEDIARGHKMAIRTIPEGQPVVKYGNPIGLAKAEIPAGAWAHVHNVRTGLSESADYTYNHKVYDKPAVSPRTFLGYRRPDGRAAVRDQLLRGSRPLMKYANMLTFNTRAICLYVSCLLDCPWVYLLIEVLVFTLLYIYMHRSHEHLCEQLYDQLKTRTCERHSF